MEGKRRGGQRAGARVGLGVGGEEAGRTHWTGTARGEMEKEWDGVGRRVRRALALQALITWGRQEWEEGRGTRGSGRGGEG